MFGEDNGEKDLVRSVFKDVVIKSLGETLQVMKLEVTDDNISRLQLYHESIKRKLGSLKTIEKELSPIKEVKLSKIEIRLFS